MDLKERDLAQRLIAPYNEQYAKVFAAARQKGRTSALHCDVAALFSGSTGLAELFRGLEFRPDGTLPYEPVLRNLDAIRSSQKLEVLRQALSELLDFLLFSAMLSVEHHDEQALEERVSAILEEAGLREREAREEVGGAPIEVVGFDELDTRLPPPDSIEPDPPGRPMSVTIVPYLPDAQAYELASGLSACRTEAAFARERAEEIARLAGDSRELREAAFRAAEHAAAVIRALDQLDQLVQRLRRR